MTTERAEVALKQQLDALIKQGESSVKYNKAYQPAPARKVAEAKAKG
jgi:hypothetical protein